MASRHQTPDSASKLVSPCNEISPKATTSQSGSLEPKSSTAWVDPALLPYQGDTSSITGNAPDYIKQLCYNTYIAYGVGGEGCFGYEVGKAVKFVDINVNRNRGRLEATTVAEVTVTKHMLNGAGMLHGGCITHLIDNTPLVVLGLLKNVNGVGVTQSLNVIFHAPAPLGAHLKIINTSISMGGRIMSSRCEIVDNGSGRIVASAYMNKMQPVGAKL